MLFYRKERDFIMEAITQYQNFMALQKVMVYLLFAIEILVIVTLILFIIVLFLKLIKKSY